MEGAWGEEGRDQIPLSLPPPLLLNVSLGGEGEGVSDQYGPFPASPGRVPHATPRQLVMAGRGETTKERAPGRASTTEAADPELECEVKIGDSSNESMSVPELMESLVRDLAESGILAKVQAQMAKEELAKAQRLKASSDKPSSQAGTRRDPEPETAASGSRRRKSLRVQAQMERGLKADADEPSSQTGTLENPEPEGGASGERSQEKKEKYVFFSDALNPDAKSLWL